MKLRDSFLKSRRKEHISIEIQFKRVKKNQKKKRGERKIGDDGDDNGQREGERTRARECNVHQLLTLRFGSERDRTRILQRHSSGRVIPPFKPEAGRTASLLHPLFSPRTRSVFKGTLPLHLPLSLSPNRFRKSLTDFSISQDFDKVWPIFDSAQSRDFRKVNLNTASFV